MISLVVCSVNPNYLAQLRANVAAHIGVEHEWLVWDNRLHKKGLCEVYNLLAQKAKYPYVCFLHEDLLIETLDWGKLLVDVCRLQQVALIGVAGGKYKSKFFSGWYSGGSGMDYYHLIHREKGVEEKMFQPEVWSRAEEQVASIDGVFMFCETQVWRQLKFDETLLKAFHYYDIDFSMRVAQQFKVVVTNKLRLIHFSKGGDFGSNWVNETINWHQAKNRQLPFSVAQNVKTDIDMKAAKYWLDWLKNMKLTLHEKQRWVGLQQLYKYPQLWYSIAKFVLYKPLRLKALHYFFIKRKS